MKQVLKQPWLNGWSLFWLVVLPLSAVVALEMVRLGAGLNSGPGVSAMISLSVRCAVPCLLLAFAASSIQVLRPGAVGLWLLRNRKYFGLAFAAMMAWQALFIIMLVTKYRDYYISEVYLLRDVIEGLIGYGFLIAMTLTSFMPLRKRLRPKTWKWLHKIGIYSLWIYVFSVYWWNLSLYPDPRFIDYVFYIAAFGTWFLRAAAWGKKRYQKRVRRLPNAVHQPALMALGGVLVVFGVGAASTGLFWQPRAEALLWGYELTRWPELYLPYWPFEPFLPLPFVLAGIAVWVNGRTGSESYSASSSSLQRS